MTLIHCFCWLNIERNHFHAAHNDLMATVITEGNLMVDDSYELSSKVFTTFPSFLCEPRLSENSHSSDKTRHS